MIEKILYNESSSERIDKDFTIKKVNRKLRKTIQFYKRFKGNNIVDRTIVLREKQQGLDYNFVVLEGTARILAIKGNKRITP